MKAAREKDKSITKEDVEEFVRKNVEEERKPRGENSFVEHHAHFESQLDFIFISKKGLASQQLKVFK